MRNRFNVDNDEKRRILSLHENSLKKNYLNLIVEQEQYYKGTDGKVGMLQGPQILPAGATAITKQEYDTAMATQKATNNEVKPEVKTAGNQEWLTYGNDKNYQYKKVGNDWITKNVKTNKEYNLTQLSTQPKFAGYKKSIEKLESTFPGGKAPASTPSGGSGNQQSTVNSQVGGTSSTATTANTQTQINTSGGEGKVSELTGVRIFDNTNAEQPTTTSVNALVPFKIDGFTNNTTTPITIKLWKGDTDLVTSDLKVPMTLQPKQSTGPFQVFIKVVDLKKSGDGWSPNQSVHSELDVAGPLRMKSKLLGYDIFGKLNLYGNDNTFITLKFKRTILVKN